MIKDPEVAELGRISMQLKNSYVRSVDPWENSPFKWIKSLPSRTVGKVGEELITLWLRKKGFRVSRAGDVEADLIVNGRRVEVKFSTLWDAGFYKFQQLRDQDYDYAICLGLSPYEVHCWLLPKYLLMKHVIGHRPQHKGKEGQDTYWLQVKPSEVEPWMREYGGTLSQAYQVIKRELGSK